MTAMSAEVRVVNLREESFDVYIGRRSNRYATGDTGFWGNPFIIPYDGDRATVIEKYEQHIRASEEHMRRLPELVGKRLGCFCKPLPCHGDVLVKLLEELDGATGDPRGQEEDLTYGTRGSTSADSQETPSGTVGHEDET
jgi:hypothetical protein